MNTRKLEIKNADGLKLGAKLDLPEDREPVAYALVCPLLYLHQGFQISLLYKQDPDTTGYCGGTS